MLDLGLTGSHVLVTGANGGIGSVTVSMFLAQGAHVTAQYNSTSSVLDDFPSIHPETGAKLVKVQCNVTDEAQVVEMFRQAEAGVGKPVTILVLNHAIYEATPAPLHSMSLQQFTQTININLTGSFLVLRAFLARLHEVKAKEPESSILRECISIVMIGSTAGEFGEANHADYAASKSAMTKGLLLSLKNELPSLSPKARANAIAPGWVSTPMATASLAIPEIRYQAMATTPLNKVATPEEVAKLIMILASDVTSGHLTGEVIKCHGGMEGRLLNPK